MKKMKLALTGLFTLVLIFACGGCKKTSPEDEVRNYSKYFIDKVTANQLDSIKASYPDILVADSIVPLQSDTIVITETQTPGLYEVTLAEGVTLKVNRSEDGNITVEESKGLFAYPSDKVEVAKKSGMWDNNLNDAQLAERMKDKDFFDYLKKSKAVNKNSLISFTDFIETPGQEPMGNYARDGYHNVTNNTDVEISENDYSFVYREGYWWPDDESDLKMVKKGKTIPPHGTVRTDASAGYHSWSVLESIKWHLTPEELQEKFAIYTGNEYQEYLDSKK